MKMGNIVHTSLAFCTSVLSITPPRLPDVLTLLTLAYLCGPLPEINADCYSCAQYLVVPQAGGRYAKGVIVKTYTPGALINISVEITAAHLGWFEFRLCKNDNVNKSVKPTLSHSF